MDADEGGSGATLTVGPTSRGMVRILVQEGGAEIPMDFEPDEAVEIADELRGAAERARAAVQGGASAGRAPARPDGGRRR